jgi:hypothetical protein
MGQFANDEMDGIELLGAYTRKDRG